MAAAFVPEGMTPSIEQAFDSMWPNIGAAIDDRADRLPNQIGWMFPDKHDTWTEMTWSEFRTWTHRVAAGILALGIKPGEVASICSATSIRWVVADLAMSTVGITTNTIYPNTREDDVHFILDDADSVTVFAQNKAIVEKITVHTDLADRIRHIIVMDEHASSSDEFSDPRIISWSHLEALGRKKLADDPTCVRTAQDATNHDTLATIIYTSGTTGRPKGVEITQGTWIYEAVGWGANDSIRDRQIHYIWLPLSHAFGKCMLLISLYTGTINAIDGRINKIVENLGTLKPSLMCGVPRIFEKVRAGVLSAAPEGSPKRKIIDWAMAVGEESFPYRSRGLAMPGILAAKYALADKLVYSKVRQQLGGRLDFLISGSAKLNPQLQRWFFNLGIPLLEGYGVTETAAVTYYNRVQELTFGSVGKIIPGSAARIDPETGEILVKGPCVMRGYHNDPELTASVIEDGWFHTGDVGFFDKDRFLYITDRIKDVIKTSNGKFVSPAEVESMITSNSSAISQAVVVGEGHKFCVALLSLDPDWVNAWAKAHGYADLSYSDAVRLPEIRAAVQRDVDAANSHLGRWETVKRFAILDAEMTPDEGTATPTLKIRRSHVVKHFKDVIAELYADEASASEAR
ncbi:long-chain fatty acid--CoA ligase [Arcanobacterium haemolyticum]|nr:long-chain fatty acid--CoA ligase [Arcanobacterium haemolyticum]